MRVIQITYNAYLGDGVTNCMLYLDKVIKKAGFNSRMYAKNVDDTITDYGVVQFRDLSDIEIDKEDILIYSFSIGIPLNYEIERLYCKKILLFQNVTPPEFFRGINDGATMACLSGLLDAKCTVRNYLKALVPSSYSKSLLVEMGWDEKNILVVPLILFEEKCKSDQDVLDKYNDGLKNIIFVGRVVPNKKHEDIIRIFDYYQKQYDDNVRLIFVGSCGEKKYYDALLRYCNERLKCKNVVFAGHVSENELASYYELADLFICMSEHEGLCLPVLEAMRYGVPVIAYKSTAVTETVGSGGILVDNKDADKVAELMNKVLTDDVYRERVIQNGKEHIEEFNLEPYEDTIAGIIRSLENTDSYRYAFQDEVLDIKDVFENYKVGEVISFVSNINSLKYVISGIDSCDSIGAWTTEKYVHMGFCLNDIASDVYVHIFCSTLQDVTQRVEIKANGKTVDEIDVLNQSIIHFKIQKELISEKQLHLTLHIPNSARPCDLFEESSDYRELGLCISKLVISHNDDIGELSL